MTWVDFVVKVSIVNITSVNWWYRSSNAILKYIITVWGLIRIRPLYDIERLSPSLMVFSNVGNRIFFLIYEQSIFPKILLSNAFEETLSLIYCFSAETEMLPVCRDSGHSMCHPTKSEGARPVGVSRVVKSWSPFQIVRSINKKIINNGADLSKKIVRVTGKAKNKGKCPRTMHNVGCPGYATL